MDNKNKYARKIATAFIFVLIFVVPYGCLLFATIKNAHILPITIGLFLGPIYAFILRKRSPQLAPFELAGISLFLALVTVAIIWGGACGCSV